MRVLKGSSRKFDPLYMLTCGTCEAIIECNRSEMVFTERTAGSKEGDSYEMNCPCCAKKTSFDYQLIKHFEMKD